MMSKTVGVVLALISRHIRMTLTGRFLTTQISPAAGRTSTVPIRPEHMERLITGVVEDLVSGKTIRVTEWRWKASREAYNAPRLLLHQK